MATHGRGLKRGYDREELRSLELNHSKIRFLDSRQPHDAHKRSQPLPHRWQVAVMMASEVHIDEMRTLLELHYDEVHTAEWLRTHDTKRVPARVSEYKVFQRVAQLHRQRLNQQLSLPTNVTPWGGQSKRQADSVHGPPACKSAEL